MDSEVYFVYVIRSIKSNILYVGLSLDPKARLLQHNAGKSKFTKGHIPWELVYTEKVGALVDARKKERYYKTSAGKRRLKHLFDF